MDDRTTTVVVLFVAIPVYFLSVMACLDPFSKWWSSNPWRKRHDTLGGIVWTVLMGTPALLTACFLTGYALGLIP